MNFNHVVAALRAVAEGRVGRKIEQKINSRKGSESDRQKFIDDNLREFFPPEDLDLGDIRLEYGSEIADADKRMHTEELGKVFEAIKPAVGLDVNASEFERSFRRALPRTVLASEHFSTLLNQLGLPYSWQDKFKTPSARPDPLRFPALIHAIYLLRKPGLVQ